MAAKKTTKPSNSVSKGAAKMAVEPQQKTIVEAIEKSESDAKQEQADQVEQAQKMEQVQKGELKAKTPDDVFTIGGVVQYWRNLVHIPSAGLVCGKVLVKDMQEFFARAPKGIELSDWMYKNDLVQKRINEARARAKKKGKDKG